MPEVICGVLDCGIRVGAEENMIPTFSSNERRAAA